MTARVIYARVSSIGDRQSTERQVKNLSEYAKNKGIEVRKVFEEHISGTKKNDERPVLCEAMEYCKANIIGRRRTSVSLCPDNDSHAFDLCAIGT